MTPTAPLPYDPADEAEATRGIVETTCGHPVHAKRHGILCGTFRVPDGPPTSRPEEYRP